jgi:hypothetical protein
LLLSGRITFPAFCVTSEKAFPGTRTAAPSVQDSRPEGRKQSAPVRGEDAGGGGYFDLAGSREVRGEELPGARNPFQEILLDSVSTVNEVEKCM